MPTTAADTAITETIPSATVTLVRGHVIVEQKWVMTFVKAMRGCQSPIHRFTTANGQFAYATFMNSGNWLVCICPAD